jgi:hypothetical protein
MSTKTEIDLPNERILRRIFLIRNEKVMLDFHLAELYGVETRALKQAVKRNIERFPDDFMFQLSTAEVEDMVSQNVIPSKSYLGGALPFAFTERGVAMLSSVLNSKRAIETIVSIIRAFIGLRKVAANYQSIVTKIDQGRKSMKEDLRKLGRHFCT